MSTFFSCFENKLFKYILLAVMIFSCSGWSLWDDSPTAGLPDYKLSSAELGTKDAISKTLNTVSSSVEDINELIQKAEKAKNERNFGISDSFYGQANKILYQWRVGIFSMRPNGVPRIAYPDSMSGIDNAFTDLVNLKHVIPKDGDLTVEYLNLILSCLRVIVVADTEFAKNVRARSGNPDISTPKVSLSFELKPFPFQLEILNGEFKIKQSFSFGNLGGQVGVSTSGQRSGITKLVLVHAGEVRYYAVGNRKLSFDVPASHLDIDGSTMTITSIY